MQKLSIRLETEYDYGAYDASMAINLLMPEDRNIIEMSYNLPYTRWEETVRSVEHGIRAIGECCWLTCPIDRNNWYRENSLGIQVSSPTKGYKN